MGLYTFGNNIIPVLNVFWRKTWSSPCNILPKENCTLNILKCVETLFTNEKETITKNYNHYFFLILYITIKWDNWDSFHCFFFRNSEKLSINDLDFILGSLARLISSFQRENLITSYFLSFLSVQSGRGKPCSWNF